MTIQEYIGIVKRDSVVVAALRAALEAMQLTHGATIIRGGVTGSLNFEKQMLDLRDSLSLFSVDPDEPASSTSLGDFQPK
jgi:hypothetical protein